MSLVNGSPQYWIQKGLLLICLSRIETKWWDILGSEEEITMSYEEEPKALSKEGSQIDDGVYSKKEKREKKNRAMSNKTVLDLEEYTFELIEFDKGKNIIFKLGNEESCIKRWLLGSHGKVRTSTWCPFLSKPKTSE